MRVVVSGSTGLVGTALSTSLTRAGHEVVRLRRGGAPADARWDPERGTIDRGRLEGADAVVHLAGEPIFARRWSPSHKDRVRRSRLEGTALLSTSLAGLRNPPAVLASASAVGYYGDRGDEILTEDSEPGSGFLAELCQGWEQATATASEAGIRVVVLRTGIVTDRDGGALKRQLPLYRLGLGGRLGSGRQHVSWISLPDAVGAITHCLHTPSLSGPVNLTAPSPVTSADFAATLGRVLRRPAVVPVPRIALEVALGTEMANEMVLASQRAVPTRLSTNGYAFSHPTLEKALRATIRSVET